MSVRAESSLLSIIIIVVVMIIIGIGTSEAFIARPQTTGPPRCARFPYLLGIAAYQTSRRRARIALRNPLRTPDQRSPTRLSATFQLLTAHHGSQPPRILSQDTRVQLSMIWACNKCQQAICHSKPHCDTCACLALGPSAFDAHNARIASTIRHCACGAGNMERALLCGNCRCPAPGPAPRQGPAVRSSVGANASTIGLYDLSGTRARPVHGNTGGTAGAASSTAPDDGVPARLSSGSASGQAATRRMEASKCNWT